MLPEPLNGALIHDQLTSLLIPVEIIADTPSSPGILFQDAKLHELIHFPEGGGPADTSERYILPRRQATLKSTSPRIQ